MQFLGLAVDGKGVISEGLDRAGFRVLHGDDSIAAARALEAVLLEEYTDDERTADLRESVALYGHADLDPYVHAQEVRALVMDTLESLSHRVTAVELSRRPGCWYFEVVDDGTSGELHARDLATAREALVARLRRDHPRVMALRWSAIGGDVWRGQI